MAHTIDTDAAEHDRIFADVFTAAAKVKKSQGKGAYKVSCDRHPKRHVWQCKRCVAADDQAHRFAAGRAKLAAEVAEAQERKAALVGAISAAKGDWRPASGGTEQPFLTKSGIRVIYLWQPLTGAHAYLNLDTDTFMTDDEADKAMRGSR